MCGIVGLRFRNAALSPELGALVSPMLRAMSPRGPDSTGLATFDDATRARVSLLAGDERPDWDVVAVALSDRLGRPVDVRALEHCAVFTVDDDVDALVAAARAEVPGALLIGHGASIEVVKNVGTADALIDASSLATRAGTCAVGHTRMATESAVTPKGSHPFAPGADMALVHNGSFSNYASVRRQLADSGATFDSDNDSEVCARVVADRLERGGSLAEALDEVVDRLDGFYTLLAATATEFAVLRDAVGCKPAIVAETADYVAVASEYHALTGLPGIEHARIFEPLPAEVHAWTF